MTAAIRPHLSSFDEESFVRPVHRMVWHPVPAPLAVHKGRRPITGRVLLVIGDDHGLVAEVAAGLRAVGATVDEATPDHELPAGEWDGIVDLNVTGAGYDLDTGVWRDALRRTTRMIQHRYPDWSTEVRADHCGYLTVTAMGGLMGYRDAGDGQPLGGIWAGFAKCLPRELPNLAVKVVDVDRVDPASVTAAVLAELEVWDLFEIGYRDGVRHALSARRAEVPPAEFELSTSDTVLVSGGARGVGFALAEGLAERFGCHVVVTGRQPLPVEESWLTTDAARFERDCADEISRARSSAELRDVRNRHRKRTELRQVHTNLAGARSAGLAITYEPCDCTDAAQVRALLEQIPTPTAVVHNAGIDEPKRLDLKTPDEVVRTIEVKVTGFANLLREVLAKPGGRAALRVFCNVGSLAGRMGGMIGQIDYAAGNESLARLGFWARDHHDLPVQTLCWPTWERLGVIANYTAAVRYVSTIAPRDAVRRWAEELQSANSDEVMFIGQVGAALVPNQLRGFWLFTGHPDLPRLHALAHFLGEVEEFEPFQRLRASIGYQAGADPCLGDFRVAGSPALPVSVLIEQACAVADWVVPPGWPVQHLTELRDIVVHLEHLRLVPDGRFTTNAVGEQRPEGWTVTVTVHAPNDVLAGSMTLVYQPTPPEPFAPAPAVGELRPVPSPAVDPLHWAGIAIGNPTWSANPDGATEISLPTVTANDLWTSPFPPTHGIAPAALEALVRVACIPNATTLRIASLTIRPGAQHVRTLYGNPGSASWLGTHADETVLSATLC